MFLVSSLRKRVFWSSTTSPSFIAATAAFAFSPTTVSSSANTTGLPRYSDRRSATGARENFASGPFFGLPRWLHRITLPPSAISFLMVGSAATMRLSLVILPSFIGTLKSQRTSTFLPETLMSSTVIFAMGNSSISIWFQFLGFHDRLRVYIRPRPQKTPPGESRGGRGVSNRLPAGSLPVRTLLV